MRQAFKERTFKAESLAKIQLCNEIIDRYTAQGLRLTLRQLYYQLVTVNAIVNKETEYDNLGKLVSEARLAGKIDWDAIEDRVRVPRQPSEFENLSDLIEAACSSYRLPRWKGQKFYVELWVEKDALSGVLAPIASEFHVTLMVNRGYSSQSAMYESGLRFRRACKDGQRGILIYLGDHDPSGEDMVRDVQDRLDLFGCSVEVEKIALTMAQVRQYNPPPNPAKMTDSRSAAYVAIHGASSWEVDALPPDVLAELIRRRLREIANMAMMRRVMKKEEEDKGRLRELTEDAEASD